MNIQDAEIYLKQKEGKLLAGGKSGARVYDIDGKYVLKQIYRKELGNDGLYMAYRREAWWYGAGSKGLDCLPKVLDLWDTEDEISILMKQYRRLSRQELSEGLLEKIMKTLAAVHTAEIPLSFVAGRHGAQPLSEEEIRASVEGWQGVLGEHPGIFDETPLKQIAEKINKVILWHDSEEAVLCHGDFHWDNLLMDEGGRILICDWQGVGAGQASGDLSFFFSRLRGDGIEVNERQTVEAYGREAGRLSGRTVKWEEVDGHIRAANLITSFTCWHEYLHGSGEGRVREIYGKMAEDSKAIID